MHSHLGEKLYHLGSNISELGAGVGGEGPQYEEGFSIIHEQTIERSRGAALCLPGAPAEAVKQGWSPLACMSLAFSRIQTGPEHRLLKNEHRSVMCRQINQISLDFYGSPGASRSKRQDMEGG